MSNLEEKKKKAYRQGFWQGILAGLPLLIAMILLLVWIAILLSGCAQ